MIKDFFSSTTQRGRVVRTILQAVAGILTFTYGLLSLPDVQHYLVTNNIVAIGTLAAFIGLASYLYNAVEKLLKWLMSEGN
jgi:hypothetical protein